MPKTLGVLAYRQAMLAGLVSGILAFSACALIQSGTSNLAPEDKALTYKYRGIYGGVLYFDASGYPKQNVTMHTENGKIWMATRAGYGSGGAQMTFTDSMYIPRSIRIVWRTGDVREKMDERGHPNYHVAGFEGGTILGDYTVRVAERIDDKVLDYIRTNGGALRIKIRLKDDGVLVGWDVEKIVYPGEWKPGLGLHGGVNYLMPGGDFREAQISNGKVIDPGWEN